MHSPSPNQAIGSASSIATAMDNSITAVFSFNPEPFGCTSESSISSRTPTVKR